MEKVYLAVTADEYELPVCVETDYRVLASKYNISPNCLLSSISHGHVGRYRGVKFMRVLIDDEEKEVINIPRKEKVVKPKKAKENKRMILCEMEL